MKRILKILFILTILCLGGAMRAWQSRLIPIVQQQLTMRMRIQSHPFSEQLKITKPVIFLI
ncbi:hypothetical protein T481_17310 [Enterococcus faecalis PF3]|nr:hypothetical protein T481_17310 [Enterococcus faecalis PF3]